MPAGRKGEGGGQRGGCEGAALFAKKCKNVTGTLECRPTVPRPVCCAAVVVVVGVLFVKELDAEAAIPCRRFKRG